jgi:hypothetical protein
MDLDASRAADPAIVARQPRQSMPPMQSSERGPVVRRAAP